MMKSIASIFLIAIFGCASCTRNSVQHELTGETLAYESPDELFSFLEDISVMGAVADEQIIVEARLKNHSDLNLVQWELQTARGLRRASISVTEQSKDSVGNSIIEIVFEPVHDPAIFQLTGLRGELQRDYTLSGTKNGKVEIMHFTADEEMLRETINHFAIAKIPYVLRSVSADNPEISLASLHENESRINGNEFLSNGLWMKFYPVLKDDSLHLELRMVNQSESLLIKIADLKLETKGESISGLSSLGDFIEVPKGGRSEISLTYPLNRGESFSFHFSATEKDTHQRIGYLMNFDEMKTATP